MSARYLRLRRRATGEVLLARVQVCDSFWCKLRGLTFRRSLAPGEGLLLVEKGESRTGTAIHMLFMRFDIAAVWLTGEGRVADTALARAWRPAYLPRRPARYVLEAAPALLQRLKPGDEVDFEDLP
ncbi:MAG: DUF192 domain-containing protein [Chloroflexi bacterium]|nr:DUF192 domain-containing protein [Chloroflexota bacterium]